MTLSAPAVGSLIDEHLTLPLRINPYTCLADFLDDLEWTVETGDNQMVLTYTAKSNVQLISDHLKAVDRYEKENANAVGHTLVSVRMDSRYRCIYAVIDLPRGPSELAAYLERVDVRARELKEKADNLQLSIELKASMFKST